MSDAKIPTPGRRARAVSVTGVAFAILCSTTLALAIAGVASIQDYDIRSEGKRIGSLQIQTLAQASEGVPFERITATTHIRIRYLFFTVFSLDEENEIDIDQNGARRFLSRAVIDGDSVDVLGNREDGVFAFQVRTQDETTRIEIPRESYDTTSAENPVPLLPAEGNTVQLRVLDLDRLEVFERRFTWIRSERVEVEGNPILCRVIEFEDSLGRDAAGTRWVTADGTLIKETGTDEDGPYAVELVGRG